MKILATEKFISQEVPVKLLEIGEIDEFDQWLPDDTTPLFVQIERSSPDILFVGLRHQLTKELLAKAPNLKIIATRTTGLDHIDLEYCQENKIQVLSLRGEQDFLSKVPATAELTFIMMGQLLRQTRHELKGKILGIIGYGRIGKLLDSYAKAFGMDVIRADKDEQGIYGLESLLASSDIVSLNITADEDNRNFMDLTKFQQMRHGTWFINSSRGWLVDNQALEWALGNRLVGAWSDFKVDFDHPNLLITDHQGGKTIESLSATEAFMADKLINYVKNN